MSIYGKRSDEYPSERRSFKTSHSTYKRNHQQQKNLQDERQFLEASLSTHPHIFDDNEEPIIFTTPDKENKKEKTGGRRKKLTKSRKIQKSPQSERESPYYGSIPSPGVSLKPRNRTSDYSPYKMKSDDWDDTVGEDDKENREIFEIEHQKKHEIREVNDRVREREDSEVQNRRSEARKWMNRRKRKQSKEARAEKEREMDKKKRKNHQLRELHLTARENAIRSAKRAHKPKNRDKKKGRKSERRARRKRDVEVSRFGLGEEEEDFRRMEKEEELEEEEEMGVIEEKMNLSSVDIDPKEVEEEEIMSDDKQSSIEVRGDE